jgi:hypothetical protein
LSKQEKYILELLSNGLLWKKQDLSFKVAEHFNKNGSRIERFRVKDFYDSHQQKTFMLNADFQVLTNKHSASFSRTIKRLINRELVEKVERQQHRYSGSVTTYYKLS